MCCDVAFHQPAHRKLDKTMLKYWLETTEIVKATKPSHGIVAAKTNVWNGGPVR